MVKPNLIATDEISSHPLVSVIIAFFNAEKFIREGIDSVFAQTYDRWELFLVDDGSTDNSTTIAWQYAKQYSAKVRYLEHDDHQNRGACASRNLGIRNSKGDFIAILDADDVWLPYKLERQVAILVSQPEAAMVYGTAQYWNSWTGKPEDIQRDYIPELGLQPDNLFNPPTLLTLCYPLGKATAPCPSDLLLRREIVERVGGFEEHFRGIYQLYEDQAFLAKVYLRAPVFVTNECWIRYRSHPDSCMSKTMGEYHSIRLFFLNWLSEYLVKHGVKDIEVWKALQRALWPYHHPVLHCLLGPPQRLAELMKDLLRLIRQRILAVRL